MVVEGRLKELPCNVCVCVCVCVCTYLRLHHIDHLLVSKQFLSPSYMASPGSTPAMPGIIFIMPVCVCVCVCVCVVCVCVCLCVCVCVCVW